MQRQVPFASYWMHNAFLNIDNRKMCKSLGNFFTVREIGEKYDLQVLRFFMLSAHYRSPLNFSAELMEASKNGSGADHHRCGSAETSGRKCSAERADRGREGGSVAEPRSLSRQKFEEAMDDDFNTADAICAIFELVKFCKYPCGRKAQHSALLLH